MTQQAPEIVGLSLGQSGGGLIQPQVLPYEAGGLEDTLRHTYHGKPLNRLVGRQLREIAKDMGITLSYKDKDGKYHAKKVGELREEIAKRTSLPVSKGRARVAGKVREEDVIERRENNAEVILHHENSPSRGVAEYHHNNKPLPPPPIHDYKQEIPMQAKEALKEELELKNEAIEEEYRQSLVQYMANQPIQLDLALMRTFLQTKGIDDPYQQEKILQEVQARTAGGRGEPVSLKEQQRQEEENMAKNPKLALDNNQISPLMGDLEHGQFVPRTGTTLASNMQDKGRLSKPISVVKRPTRINELKRVLLKGTLDNAIKANHSLSQLSQMEKNLYDVPEQGSEITKYNPNLDTYIEMIDGLCQR